jgi:hypothetical protein
MIDTEDLTAKQQAHRAEMQQPQTTQAAMLQSQLHDAEAAATRLANALKDLYNIAGNLPEVQEAVSRVERDIAYYAEVDPEADSDDPATQFPDESTDDFADYMGSAVDYENSVLYNGPLPGPHENCKCVMTEVDPNALWKRT